MTNIDQRSIEILAQVVYKELAIDRRHNDSLWDDKKFWARHKEETEYLMKSITDLTKPKTNKMGDGPLPF